MFPDWPTLFNSQPLAERALELLLPGLAVPVWFASARVEDLNLLPPEQFLSEAECARASQFKFSQPRENFALGRLAGKLALRAGSSRREEAPIGRREMEPPDVGCYLRVVEIGNGERGEPVVCVGDLPTPPSFATTATDGDCKSPALGVSLSHVNGLGVAVGFPTNARVGLDLERVDPKRAETVRRGVPLSAEEEGWLKETALPEATALLFLWTAREALGKALGCGLACKWESLALRAIANEEAGQVGGRYAHHPQFRCVCWVTADVVLAVAWEEG